MSLKTALVEWTDWDLAAYHLGVSIGMFDPEKSPFATKAKHVFWSNHPIGSWLDYQLLEMVPMGVLEFRSEPDRQFRWNPTFSGSWE